MCYKNKRRTNIQRFPVGKFCIKSTTHTVRHVFRLEAVYLLIEISIVSGGLVDSLCNVLKSRGSRIRKMTSNTHFTAKLTGP